MKAPRKTALAALAVTGLALVTPMTPASADNPGDTLSGGCGYNTNQNAILTNGQNQGVIYVAASSQDGSPATPSGATVSCWIDVNGVQATATLTTHGTGVIANSAQISFSAFTGDQITECQQVTFDDGSPWVGPDGTNPDCPAVITIEPPDLGDRDAAYCPYGSITGVGNWAPPETTTIAPHVFVWDTNATCTGAGDEDGGYNVVFSGTSNDACTAGTGSGTLSGNGPEGPITGSFTFYRGGIHLYISGTFFSGDEQHNLQYWLDVLASTSGVCSYTTAALIGHGAIVDSLVG